MILFLIASQKHKNIINYVDGITILINDKHHEM